MRAQEPDATAALQQLRTRFEAGVAILNQPRIVLNTDYRDYLEKQKGAYKAAGKLEAMLAVDAELKSYESDPAPKLSPFPELKRLQAIYRKQRDAAAKNYSRLKLQLIRGYRDDASKLASEWTKAGRIKEAKLALAEAKRFGEMEKDPSLAVAKIAGTYEGSRAGEEMTNGLGMKLCWIPAGEFTMGSPNTEGGRQPEREAQVQVELTYGFWVGKYEVKQEEYEKVVGNNPSHRKGKRSPVERITWNEAGTFCRKLTEWERKLGKLPAGWIYRLPTEAQWEYACRAGKKGSVSGGKLDEVA